MCLYTVSLSLCPWFVGWAHECFFLECQYFVTRVVVSGSCTDLRSASQHRRCVAREQKSVRGSEWVNEGFVTRIWRIWESPEADGCRETQTGEQKALRSPVGSQLHCTCRPDRLSSALATTLSCELNPLLQGLGQPSSPGSLVEGWGLAVYRQWTKTPNGVNNFK